MRGFEIRVCGLGEGESDSPPPRAWLSMHAIQKKIAREGGGGGGGEKNGALNAPATFLVITSNHYLK